MKIFNLMFGKKKGGLEKAALDYALALTSLGHDVTTYLNPKSEMIPAFQSHNLDLNTSICNLLGSRDFIARYTLGRQIKKHRPDVCITHGRRAAYFAQKNKVCPTIAVSHSFNVKALQKTERLIAINTAMKNHALQQGYSSTRIQVAENFLPVTSAPSLHPLSNNTPIRIGAMARLIKRKGIDVFLRALHQMKMQKIPFQAIVAGTGEELESLKALCTKLELDTHVEFKGWMPAEDFFKCVDIFCMPSRTEPFGLVILEAWYHGVPIIATEAEGPKELIINQENGLLSPVDDPVQLATALTHLSQDLQLRESLRTHGHETLNNRYLLPHGAERINQALRFFL
jgi:glycosyltransferase involved in cell wall biosynthesis